LSASPQAATISSLRCTLPAPSKAITESPWSAMVFIAGSITVPDTSMTAAGVDNHRDVLGAWTRASTPRWAC
jgi:hypothetical protein